MHTFDPGSKNQYQINESTRARNRLSISRPTSIHRVNADTTYIYIYIYKILPSMKNTTAASERGDDAEVGIGEEDRGTCPVDVVD